MMTCALLAVLAAAVPEPAAAAPTASAPAITQVVVLAFAVDKSIDPKAGALLDEVFLSELEGLKPAAVKLVGSSDVTAVIGLEQQKQLAGCSDASCLIEIGNALGASHVIAPTLGKLGEQYLVGAKLLATRDANVLFRKVLYTEASEQPMLLGVRQIAGELAVSQGWASADRIATTAAPSIGAASQPGDDGPGALFWTGAIMAGGGALAAVGLGAGALALDQLIVGGNSTDWQLRQSMAWPVLISAGGAGVAVLLAVTGGVLLGVSAL